MATQKGGVRRPTRRLAGPIVLALVAVSGGCSTAVGIAPGDVPPCPSVVILEALRVDETCLSDEALNALAGHCEALEVMRR